MKSCKGCVFAKWDTTASGRLHPSGDGKCTKEFKVPPLPAAFYWMTPPTPYGGLISRKKENSDHCPYYNRAP